MCIYMYNYRYLDTSIYTYIYILYYYIISWCVLISVGVHYCVPRLQNNSESVEMMGGSLLCLQDFWGEFSVFVYLFYF